MAKNYISGLGYTISMKIKEDDVETSVDLCPTSVEVTSNESLATWVNLCGKGLSSNAVTSINPNFAVTCKYDLNNKAHILIMQSMLSASKKDREFGFAISEATELSSYEFSFNGVINGITESLSADAIRELSFTISIADGEIFVA